MNRREQFKKMNHYALYYGTGRAEQLTHFDVVIVEPKGQSKEEVERIQQTGTLVIAYISVIEISPDSNIYKFLKDEDFLLENGQKVVNESFGTYLLNLRSARWMGLLHHQVGQFLLHDGFDGIFLDTIGDVERTDLSPLNQHEQQNAAIALVAQLREYFPDYIIIQNNGLETLCHETISYIDGLIWENPPFLTEASHNWMNQITQKLKSYKQDQNLQVLILLENDSQSPKAESIRSSAISYASEHSFPIYIAPSNYTLTVNEEEELAETKDNVLGEHSAEQLQEHVDDYAEPNTEELDKTQKDPSPSSFDEYYSVLIQELKWIKKHSHPILFEEKIKEYLLSPLPDLYHYTLATLLIEVYEKTGEKEKLKQLVLELINRYQNHPFLSNLLKSYLSQLT